MLPLLEAKMIHLYDSKWATYEPDGSTRDVTLEEKQDPDFAIMPRYWVAEAEVDSKLEDRWDKHWLLGWRDICRATDVRTTIATILPRLPVGNKIPVAMPSVSKDRAANLQMTLSSFALDFASRQKMGGSTMNFFILMQLPTLTPRHFLNESLMGESLVGWVARRVDRLNGWVSDEDLRAMLRAELDSLAFHLYGLRRDEVEFIMDTFPIVERNDVAIYGEFRTKRLIIESYEAMTVAIKDGRAYESAFDLEVKR